jgi:hypothetical protein
MIATAMPLRWVIRFALSGLSARAFGNQNLKLAVAPRAGLPGESGINGLDCKTDANAPAEAKGVSGTLANLPVLPLITAEWDRNSREIVRVALDQSNGRHTINARVWYREGDEVRPSKSGITLALKQLPALAEAVGKALDAGLLHDDGGEQ